MYCFNLGCIRKIKIWKSEHISAFVGWKMNPFMGNLKKNEDFSVIKFFVNDNFKDEIHIHFI